MVGTSKTHSLLAALQQQQQLPMLSVQPQVSCEEAGGRLLGVWWSTLRRGFRWWL